MNNETAAIILAIGSLLTAIVTAAIALYNTRRTARKDELGLLRGEVERLAKRLEASDKRIEELEQENRTLHRQVATLGAENAALRAVLQTHGIEVPVLPAIGGGQPCPDHED